MGETLCHSRWLVAGFSAQKLEFNSKAVHLGFVVVKEHWGRFPSELFGVPPLLIITLMPHSFIYHPDIIQQARLGHKCHRTQESPHYKVRTKWGNF
jgi:hypothetical protein